eukprot:scaffold12862_cov55-Attheya_sp.AAC.4
MAAYLSAADYRDEANHNVSRESDGGPAYASVGSADEFIVVASTGLLVLFFLKIYNITKIIPLYSRACIYMAGPNIHPKIICTLQCLEIGHLNDIDILVTVSGYSLGLVAWTIVAFVVEPPKSNTLFLRGAGCVWSLHVHHVSFHH